MSRQATGARSPERISIASEVPSRHSVLASRRPTDIALKEAARVYETKGE